MIGQSIFEARSKNRCNEADKFVFSNAAQSLTQVNGPQVDFLKLEKKTSNNVQSEVDGVLIAPIKTRTQDAVMTSMENLALLRVE